MKATKPNRYVKPNDDGTVSFNPIQALLLYQSLRMQVKFGMHLTNPVNMGGTAYAVIKREFGLRGNKQAVLDQFRALLIGAGMDPSKLRE